MSEAMLLGLFAYRQDILHDKETAWRYRYIGFHSQAVEYTIRELFVYVTSVP